MLKKRALINCATKKRPALANIRVSGEGPSVERAKQTKPGALPVAGFLLKAGSDTVQSSVPDFFQAKL